MTEAAHRAENGERDDDTLEQRVSDGPRGGSTWYDVLEVAHDATAAEVKRAYDRAIALVEGRNIGGYLMLDPVAAESARADVETAYQVLGDPERRAAYDDKLREQGRAPAARTADAGTERPEQEPAKAASTSSGASADARAPLDDQESREAREILAVADWTASSPPSAEPRRTVSSPGLKFLAPVAAESDPFAAKPTTPAIRFEDPKTEDRPPVPEPSAPERAEAHSAPVMNDAHNAVTVPSMQAQRDAPRPVSMEASAMEASATQPPDAAMPGPSGAAPASTGGLPEGDIDGAAVRALREARGLTLEQLADATKIRKPYLKAIEEQDLQNLPARVYLRGFLTQIGRVLRVDRARLADGYVACVEKHGMSSPT